MAAEQSPAATPFDLARIQALTFDVGGTVFDWHATIRDAVQDVAQGSGVPPPDIDIAAHDFADLAARLGV